MYFIVCALSSYVAPTYFAGETFKNSCENVRQTPEKENLKFFETSLKEARQKAGNIEGYDFRTWLTPFITTHKTESDASVKVALS